MQKKVLAAVIGGLLATPAVFAADATNVTISGRIAVGFENYKVSGGTAPSYNNEQRLSDQSSSLVFSGSEDLGGGLKGVFQIDNRFAPDLGGFGATGNTWLGLAGGFGRVLIGRHDLHYNEFDAIGGNGRSGSLQSWLGRGPASQVNGNSIANATRTPNVAVWESNKMGGVTARVAYSTSWAATEGSGRGTAGDTNPGADAAMTAAVRWSSGPLTVGASLWDAKVEGKPATGNSEAGDQKSNRAWVGYTFGPVTVGFGADNSQRRMAAGESFTKRTAYLVPVTFKAGSETFVATLSKVNKLSGPNGGATIDNTDASAIGFGWDHALSKRTSVGVFYTKVDNKANASYDLFGLGANGATNTAAGEDAQQLYFGVTHTY